MNSENQVQSAFQRVTERLEQLLVEMEQQTWDTVVSDLEQAIELEAAAEELTLEEVGLLRAYLAKDLRGLQKYVVETGKGVADWLKFDIHLLEDTFVARILSLADNTLVLQRGLQENVDERSLVYGAGETILAGTLVCDGCGASVSYRQPTQLVSCSSCGGEIFSRISA